MAFFNLNVPLVSRKQLSTNFSIPSNVWFIHFKVFDFTLLSSFYTRHDQACLLWGVVSFCIFAIAQFIPVSWVTQAAIASVLTALACLGMALLTWHFTRVERLWWVLIGWVVLMLVGVILTDLSLIKGWALVGALCPLWLGLCGVGYLVTGVGMRSRTLLFCGVLHLLAIELLPYVLRWQILITGMVISGCVIALAELQWDSNGVCQYQLTDVSSST